MNKGYVSQMSKLGKLVPDKGLITQKKPLGRVKLSALCLPLFDAKCRKEKRKKEHTCLLHAKQEQWVVREKERDKKKGNGNTQ